MKTKELIKKLQKIDPLGDLEVCVSNKDIYIIERIEAYWDGSLQVLIRDKTNPYYNVIGAEFIRNGEKIRITTLSIEDAIWQNPNLPVKCTYDSDKQNVEHWKKEAVKDDPNRGK